MWCLQLKNRFCKPAVWEYMASNDIYVFAVWDNGMTTVPTRIPKTPGLGEGFYIYSIKNLYRQDDTTDYLVDVDHKKYYGSGIVATGRIAGKIEELDVTRHQELLRIMEYDNYPNQLCCNEEYFVKLYCIDVRYDIYVPIDKGIDLPYAWSRGSVISRRKTIDDGGVVRFDIYGINERLGLFGY